MRNFILLLAILSSCLNAFSQKNMQLRSVLPYERNLSSLWGYTDNSGNEYALVGWLNGVSIVDVTNPDTISELFRIPGPNSIWREIKTWNHHAYATNETGSGLLIADLSQLPDTVTYLYWTADTLLGTAHTLYIDENGILYLFGYNDVPKSILYEERGALICDLNPDPENPVIIGKYNERYVHDGFVRGDTLWSAEISDGIFSVIDVSDKANPVVLVTQETPNRFTHNCWLSDDGMYLFTTDERPGSFIASYDVSDLGNIKELDRYQAAPGTFLIPHNAHFINNYLVNSYYKYGANILDATLPDNLVEVGYYDTSPFSNSEGFAGCWGVYPYFPSGLIVASDMETGLYVLTPDYKRACYLEGKVTNEDSGFPINDVSVEIMTTQSIKKTNLLGNYKTGVAEPGLYDVRFYKEGCLPKIITSVTLESAVVETLDVTLGCPSVIINSNPGLDSKNNYLICSPTPFENQTSLRYRIPMGENGSLHVYDSSGKMVFNFRLNDTEGEIIIGANLPMGIYLAKITAGNFSEHTRIVKQ